MRYDPDIFETTITYPERLAAAGATASLFVTNPYIIWFRGGPVYDPDHNLTYHAEQVADHYEGEVWSYGPIEVDRWIGGFKVRSVKVDDGSGFKLFRQFAPAVIRDIMSRRAALAGRPIVVVSYDPFVYGAIATYVAKRLGAKLVLEFPGSYRDEANFADDGPLVRWWKKWRQRAVIQLVLLQADAIRLCYPTQTDGIFWIPRRIPVFGYFDATRLEDFEPLRAPGEKLVLFVGYPYYRKGVDVLIDAWRRLAPRYPDWRLAIIGIPAGQQPPTAGLKSIGIDFLPPIKNRELAPWMGRCSVFVLPSRSDTLPRVLMEAGIACKARVATRVGGVPLMIEHEVDGLLVEPDDDRALADALDKVMGDAQLRERFGRAALESVSEKYSGAKYAADFRACIAVLFPEQRAVPVPSSRTEVV